MLMWSLLSVLHLVNTHPEIITYYKIYENELKLYGIKFPIKKEDISKIEKMNNLAINVYGNVKKEIILIHNSKQKEISENYNSNEISKHLLYLDANNLYG